MTLAMTSSSLIPPNSLHIQHSTPSSLKSSSSRDLTFRSASIDLLSAKQSIFRRLFSPYNHTKTLGCSLKPISAVGSAGLEASVSDPKDSITVKNAKILVESQDDYKMQVRVELPAEETQIVFDKVLTNLARTAPPVPGFRRQKGGKTSKVPKSFLLSIIGEDRVTKFVIQEIVSSTIADYVKKENLNVKDNKINTIQTADELKLSFKPGSEFAFNATLEIEKLEIETTSSSSSAQ